MTGPLTLSARLYQADRLLAEVKCALWPADAPVQGIALVPDNQKWLMLGTLTLAVHHGQEYRITAAKLDHRDGKVALLRFFVRE